MALSLLKMDNNLFATKGNTSLFVVGGGGGGGGGGVNVDTQPL